MIGRRGFLSAILAAGVGPAIVRAASLMPVRSIAVGDGVALMSAEHPVDYLEILRASMRETYEIAAARALNDFNPESVEIIEVEIDGPLRPRLKMPYRVRHG